MDLDHVRVYVGNSAPDLGDLSNMYRILKAQIHPKFLAQTYQFDIGIIILERKIRFNQDVAVTCVARPPYSRESTTASQCQVYGWGKWSSEDSADGQNILSKSSSHIVDDETCRNLSENFHSHYNVCARSSSLVKGDSGGCLICLNENAKPSLIGIVSSGGDFTQYAVYTKVPYFRQWLAYNENKYL